MCQPEEVRSRPGLVVVPRNSGTRRGATELGGDCVKRNKNKTFKEDPNFKLNFF